MEHNNNGSDENIPRYAHLKRNREWKMLTDEDLVFIEQELPMFADQWFESRPTFKEDELLKVFSEAKKIIPKKISEWKEAIKEYLEARKLELIKIKQTHTDIVYYWFYRELLKWDMGKELSKMKRHIARLERLRSIGENKPPKKGWISDKDIQKALAVPIENLISTKLRRGGRSLTGLCPLHEERTPSFHIYTDENRFWCYGCNQGGNAIKFVMLLYGFKFINAVKYLLK